MLGEVEEVPSVTSQETPNDSSWSSRQKSHVKAKKQGKS
jgi:hypothetical protein